MLFAALKNLFSISIGRISKVYEYKLNILLCIRHKSEAPGRFFWGPDSIAESLPGAIINIQKVFDLRTTSLLGWHSAALALNHQNTAALKYSIRHRRLYANR